MFWKKVSFSALPGLRLQSCQRLSARAKAEVQGLVCHLSIAHPQFVDEAFGDGVLILSFAGSGGVNELHQFVVRIGFNSQSGLAFRPAWGFA